MKSQGPELDIFDRPFEPRLEDPNAKDEPEEEEEEEEDEVLHVT